MISPRYDGHQVTPSKAVFRALQNLAATIWTRYTCTFWISAKLCQPQPWQVSRCPTRLTADAFTGSYGSLPLPVRAFCDELTDEVESNPDKFIRVNCINYMNRVRERVAKLIGAEMDECVIVNNTSHGLTTVLRNFTYNEGDILIGGVTIESTTSFFGLTPLLSNNNIWIRVSNTQVYRRSSTSPCFVDIQPSVPDEARSNRSRFREAHQAADKT